jgi:hypothetical protein
MAQHLAAPAPGARPAGPAAAAGPAGRGPAAAAGPADEAVPRVESRTATAKLIESIPVEDR